MAGIADLLSLLNDPPSLGVGWQEAILPASPAAGTGFVRTVPGQTRERLIAATFTFAASATVGSRNPTLGIADNNGVLLAQSPAGPDIEAGDNLTAFLAKGLVTAAGPGLSLSNTSAVTSPAAGATIVSLSLPAGRYNVAWQIALGGTVGNPEQNNMALNVNAVQKAIAEIKGASTAPTPQPPMIVDIPAGGATVTVTAIILGTVGAVYFAQVTATPVQGSTWYAPVPDLIIPPGWQFHIDVSGIQAGDAITSIGLILQRYPTNAVQSLIS